MQPPFVADDRYRPIRQIGAGGMGTVLLARDEILDRLVAVKVPADQFASDARFRARFEREAKLAARLSHPNVVAVFDAGQHEDRPYLVMEYVDGEALSDHLARSGPRPAVEAAALGAQLAAGLAHAHSLGVVHRDVKPHNVLVRPDGTAKLADFGIARAVDVLGLTDAGTVAGTAGYMAPEQALGDAGPPADVYSLGAVLHEILSGSPPARPATPSADLGPADDPLTVLVGECLRAEPELRPAAADLAACLAELAGGHTPVPLPVPAPPAPESAPTVLAPGRSPEPVESLPAAETIVAPAAGHTEIMTAPAPAPARRRYRPVAALAGFAAVVIAAVAISLGGDDPDPPPPVPEGDTPAADARHLADWFRDLAG